MNRRQFFRRTAGALAAAVVAPYLAPRTPILSLSGVNMATLSYRGASFCYDRHCPPNRVYFLNPDSIYVFNIDGVFKVG